MLFKKNVAMESDTEEPSDEGEDSDGNYNEEDESDDEKMSPTKSWERGSKRRKVGKENTNAYVTVRLPKNILSEDTLVTGKRFRIGNQGLTSVVGSLLKQAKNIDDDDSVDLNQFKLSRETTRRNVTKTMKVKAEAIK